VADISDEDARWASYLYVERDAQGREVLRNNEDIRNARELDRFERAETALRIRSLPRVSADADGLRAMHHHIFKNVYPWAGQLRTVNMGKADSDFLVASRIDTALANTFREPGLTDRLAQAPLPQAAEMLARVVSDINSVHPFREGNGRAMRAFVTAVARDSGWKFDETRIEAKGIEAKEWNRGSIESFNDPRSIDRLAATIEKAIVGRVARDDQRAFLETPANDRSVGSVTPAVTKDDPVKTFSDAAIALRDARIGGQIGQELFEQAVDHVLSLRRAAIGSVPEDHRERIAEISAALVSKTLGLSVEEIAQADTEVQATRQKPNGMRH
jgi:cell filamentation protein